jgi:hypothetical protein
MSKRRIPSNYFFKFFIFKLFIGIFHKKSDLIFWCKFKRFLYKIFKAHFILLIHYIVLLSKICQTKKTRALRDIWDRKYNSANVSTFCHGRAILFAPTVGTVEEGNFEHLANFEAKLKICRIFFRPFLGGERPYQKFY